MTESLDLTRDLRDLVDLAADRSSLDDVLRRGLDDIRAYKSPTTPGRIIDGVFNGLEQIATDLGMTRRALISSLTRFAFGTTAATNAILEGKPDGGWQKGCPFCQCQTM